MSYTCSMCHAKLWAEEARTCWSGEPRAETKLNAIIPEIISEVKEVLDLLNPLDKSFRVARDRYSDNQQIEFKLKLIGRKLFQQFLVDGYTMMETERVKMRALLIQHRCEVALEVLPADMEAQTKAELNKKAHSTEIKERSKAKGDDGEGLYARGRTNRRDSRQSRGKSRSKSRGGRLKCYICQSEDHLKRICPKNNHKKSLGYVNKDDQPSFSGSIYDGSE
nr:zinc finger, CCHC-type [Tanacetum cinerariifolium]GFA68229.1 zinc finger, CCHC-type [Tanacetum cinerariifolium]